MFKVTLYAVCIYKYMFLIGTKYMFVRSKFI